MNEIEEKFKRFILDENMRKMFSHSSVEIEEKGRRAEKRSALGGLGPFRRMLTSARVESSHPRLPPQSRSGWNVFLHS